MKIKTQSSSKAATTRIHSRIRARLCLDMDSAVATAGKLDS